MPKSKRNKLVHLTQVKKKGKDHKEELMKQLEQLVQQYEFVYMFDLDKTKSDRIMMLRLRVKGTGRLFVGSNSVVTQALKTIGSKTGTSYDNFLKHITGHRGLLFTDIGRDEMVATIEKELTEFREKLLGYAQLKTPDDDTTGNGTDEGEKMDEDDDDGDDEGKDENGEQTSGEEVKLNCVSFRPIEKMRTKKKKAKKSKKNKLEEPS